MENLRGNDCKNVRNPLKLIVQEIREAFSDTSDGKSLFLGIINLHDSQTNEIKYETQSSFIHF